RCTNDGGYTLAVTFRPGVDVGRARLLVQQRVNLALPALPHPVKRGVMVKERAARVLLFVKGFSPDPSRDMLDPCNYANLQLREPLSRLPGVADVTCLGQHDYDLRIRLDLKKLAARDLTADDVVRALEDQKAQAATAEKAKAKGTE